jgi:Domain of unknown function (DUF1330)
MTKSILYLAASLGDFIDSFCGERAWRQGSSGDLSTALAHSDIPGRPQHNPKGYWMGAYRETKDPSRLAAYAQLAAPAVAAAGGKFLY